MIPGKIYQYIHDTNLLVLCTKYELQTTYGVPYSGHFHGIVVNIDETQNPTEYYKCEGSHLSLKPGQTSEFWYTKYFELSKQHQREELLNELLQN